MTSASARAANWIVRTLVALALLVVLAAGGIWWWAGQEGSLEWLLQRAAPGALKSEGVRGSIRRGWHIQRMTWERDGLKVVAEDIRLEWQPLAILNKTLQLDEVHVARAQVVDSRPDTGEPFRLPEEVRLPWRVNVDELTLGALDLQGRTPFEARGLAARYAFDGMRHELDLKSLQVAGGSYRGKASLQAVQPMTLDAQVAGRFLAPVPGVAEKVPLTFEATAKGPVRALDARAQLRVVDAGADASTLPQATATAHITPFADMPVPRGAADFRQLDLAMFWPAAPRTLLSGHVEVAPAGTETWQLQADVRNAAAGPWDAGQLPVASARGEGEWRNGVALLKALQAQVGGGTVEGAGGWRGEGWSFAGRIDGVDPAQVHRSMAALPLSGPVKLEGEGQAIDFDVAVEAGTPRRAARANDAVQAAAGALALRSAQARGRWEGDALDLQQLRVITSDASLQGQVALQLQQRAGSGRLELRAPGLQAQAQGSVAERRGQGTATVAAADLAQLQRWLARFPQAKGFLDGLALRGQAQARLAWQGGWSDPTVQGSASASSLAWQPAATGADVPPPWVLRDANLQVNGRLREAALQLRAQARQGQRDVELAGSGTLGATLGGPATTWRGRLAQLNVQLQDPAITPGPWQLQLRQPVEWRLAGNNFGVSAGEALLRAPALRSGAAATDALLTWGPVQRQGGRLTTSGKLAGLPLAWIELVGGQQLAGSALSGDLVFDAQWDAVLGDTLRVQASLVRVRGDVNVLAESADGAAARVSAGVRDARLTLTSEGEQLVLSMLWDSERAGRVEGRVRTRLARQPDGGWTWPEQAPLEGRIQAQLPRIGVWSLLAPPGWRLRGSLGADITVAGTRAQPQLTGPVVADDLALRSVVDGIELRNGRLRAQLAGQRLVVNEFLLRGSEEGGGTGGTLLAYGEGSLTPAGIAFEAKAQLSQLRASLRSDRQLTVSGPLTARMDRSGTTVTGDLTVDRARITIPDESPPRLGDDVLVRNAPGLPTTEAERKLRPAPSEPGRAVSLRVNIDLGPDFRVSGRGVDTRLAGEVQVAGESLGVPRITGMIRTVGGTFEAYGQRMNIERGELRFTGVADNPALDILAVRPNMTQKVGVLVSGRAQSPVIDLYSEAGLSDAETLSQVVLGRSSSGGGAETALLQRAATALLAGRGGTGKGLVGRLGLDDLSVSPDSTSGAVVRVGKRFADNFYAAYERSLSGTMGTLFIFYDLSQRLTVRAEAGERTGLDLIFTFAFDRVRRR